MIELVYYNHSKDVIEVFAIPMDMKVMFCYDEGNLIYLGEV